MRALRTVLFAAALAPCLAQAEPVAEAGENIFRRCKSCHRIGEGAKNQTGPNLQAIVGRPAGSVANFDYSRALREEAADGLVWTPDALDAFIADPSGFLPGTSMSFPGIPDPEDRQNLIAFLADPELENQAASRLNDPPVPPEILAIDGDREYGEYLASECTTCHRDDATEGIPSITGWPVAAFVTAMHAYRSKAREHPVMRMMAGRLSDEEIAALAAYFAEKE